MSIEQIAFAIPPRIEAGLATGEFIRHGGVVRDTAGHIVTHLKEVPTPKLDRAIAAVQEFAKANKVTLIVGTAAVAALGVTGVTVSAVKRSKIEKAQKELQIALSSCLQAIVAQNMNLAVIDELDAALAGLRAITGKPTNELIEGDVLDALINYSRDFIKRNEPAELPATATAEIVSLEDYLAEQKRIFGKAS